MASTRARWAENVPDLYNSLDQVKNYFSSAQVSNATGLSTNTIEDALSRPEITSDTNTLGPLSRPAARVGNAPLWSKAQVQEAIRRQQSGGPRFLGGGTSQLPTVDAPLAEENGYLSTAEIAEIAHMRRTTAHPWGPVHEQTVRRWAREDDTFPPAVALRARSTGHAGVPIVVYDGIQIRAWLATQKERIKLVEEKDQKVD